MQTPQPQSAVARWQYVFIMCSLGSFIGNVNFKKPAVLTDRAVTFMLINGILGVVGFIGLTGTFLYQMRHGTGSASGHTVQPAASEEKPAYVPRWSAPVDATGRVSPTSASAERRRIELTRTFAPSIQAKGLAGVRPLVTQPDLARLLRFAASQCAFDASGLRARTIDGRSCTLPWSQLAEVRARILPADRPWDLALIVDFVPVSAEGQPAAPIRLLPLTGMSFRALPGTPASTRRENLRRLVRFALSHNAAATIEPESAPFFREAGECLRFVSISQFSEYDARYG